MKTTIKTLARFAAALALGAVTILPLVGISHAAGARTLLKGDFYNFSEWMYYETGTNVPPIAGTAYARGVACEGEFACSVSFNMQRYPGYGAFAAVVGVSDAYHYYKNEPNCNMQFDVNADGKIIYKHVFRQGQLGTRIIVPLGKATVVTLETAAPAVGHPCSFLVANPTLVPSGAQASPAVTPVTAGKITLQLFSAAASAGGQQTALITTAANALVTVVLDYPDGEQMAIGPRRAGPDGHFAYTWTLPSGLHGTVHVTVDSAGSIAQGTFTVG